MFDKKYEFRLFSRNILYLPFVVWIIIFILISCKHKHSNCDYLYTSLRSFEFDHHLYHIYINISSKNYDKRIIIFPEEFRKSFVFFSDETDNLYILYLHEKIPISKNCIYCFRLDSCETLRMSIMKINNDISDYYFDDFHLKITIDKKNVDIVLDY
jgi:hypothetical protein